MRDGLILIGFAAWALGGCVQGTLAPASQANWTVRDRQLLANAPYRQARIPGEYQRQIVDYRRKEVPGTIVVDTDNRYLYYVLPQGKAIRYGVTVGEEALAWSGVANIGRMEEWPAWVPTPEIKHRLANIPDYVSPGPHNPMGARALYLYQPGPWRLSGFASRNRFPWAAILAQEIRVISFERADPSSGTVRAHIAEHGYSGAR